MCWNGSVGGGHRGRRVKLCLPLSTCFSISGGHTQSHVSQSDLKVASSVSTEKLQAQSTAILQAINTCEDDLEQISNSRGIGTLGSWGRHAQWIGIGNIRE